MRLFSVRVPHGKFRADERIFAPALEIAAKESADIELSVSCDEPPETIVENAFLIFAVAWGQKHWRFFIRLQIRLDEGAIPAARTESITIQEAGFSGVS